MTRINPADQILIMLRAQLERAGKAKRTTGSPARNSIKPKRNALERIRGAFANGDVPPQELRRAFVSALLIEEFGEATLNDPQFQNLVDRVMATIQHDEKTNTILEKALTSLRGRE